MSTGGGSIRQQLANLDLRMIIDYSLVEWKELEEEEPTGNEWEDRKVGRRKDFLLRRMELAKHFIRTNIEPKWMVLCLLPEILDDHPVLLNRAPTLHRLGIQAFLPVLVEGRAICLHPLVCKGFNADFDGDQMAVHVPLSLEAQAEARLLMFSHMNLLSPTIGDPISAPTQDMLSGLYVLTSGNRRAQRNMEVLMAERPTQVFHNKVIDGTAMKRLISRFIDHYGIGYTSHILDQVKTLGFRQATAESISLGIDDLLTIPSKRWLVQDAEQQSFILEKHHHYGNVHAVEKLRQSIEIWYATSEYLRQEMTPNFRMTDPFNPVHIMSFSGARGNASQVHQLVGMRGLMSDPQGQMIDLPIQSNLREGLSLTEYIISCYGARKGVVDTAIRTSDAGYLTRRLVEVVQHIVVRRTDCGTVRVQNDQYVESEQVIAEIRARTSTLNLKEKVRKHIYSDSEGEMHWNTDVYHAPEFTYGISIEIPRNAILRRNSILAYFDDPRYIRKSSGLTKYETRELNSIVNEEDFIEYRGVKTNKAFRLIPPGGGKQNSKEYKKLKNWLYIQRMKLSSFISEASFQETARVLAKAALLGRIDWLKGLKENVVLGGMIPVGSGFKTPSSEPNNIPNNIAFELKKKNLLEGEMKDILKWNPKMAPYISAKRKGIHITNLTRTARFLSEACDLVFDAASRGKQFLIVGTKNKEADSVAWAAIRARCHYVNKKWLGGMLTNWSTTETRLHKFRDLRTEQKTGGLNRLPKRDAAMLKRQLSHLQTYLGGIKYMTGLPDIVIIVDQHEEYTALQECITLGIPTICLIDTNCDPDLADISIPANDDAISSIRLILNKLVFAICEGRSGYIRNS
ncbi:hypothetical protein L1987_88923 [Smallanthus sonchifolius]|nr:hypothetical protein L1987_88923 [Smallanthus sonchifolius]